jgi:hypothetical protein
MRQTSLVVFGNGFYLGPPSIVHQNALWKSFREFPVNSLASPIVRKGNIGEFVGLPSPKRMLETIDLYSGFIGANHFNGHVAISFDISEWLFAQTYGASNGPHLH